MEKRKRSPDLDAALEGAGTALAPLASGLRRLAESYGARGPSLSGHAPFGSFTTVSQKSWIDLTIVSNSFAPTGLTT